MNGYKLKKLYIENFKLITKREIDFSLLDLMILDGWNVPYKLDKIII